MSIAKWLLAKKLGGGSPFPPVIKRVTGNPIELTDAANAPMVRCVTEIQGSQDLHGYDKPWVGGAGSNKWDEVWELGSISPSDGTDQESSANIRSKNYIPVTANASYCLVIAGNITVAFRYYDSSKGFVGSGSRPGSGTFTVPTDASYMRFVVFDNYGTSYNHDIAINYPSTVTTYSPYSNICPITAYTEGEIEVRGKNKFNGVFTQGSAIDLTNTTRVVSAKVIPIVSGKTYTFSASDYSSFEYVLNSNRTRPELPFPNNGYSECGTSTSWSATAITFTATQNGYVAIVARKPNNGTISPSDVASVNCQFEESATATPYEAVKHHTTAYPSAIYRGSEDVVNGEVRCEEKLYSSLSWVRNSEHEFYVNAISELATGAIRPCMSDKFRPWNGTEPTSTYGICFINTNGAIRINTVDEYSSSADMIADIGDISIVASLATPTTSSVTPTNLPIKSLSGYTHIESSTGDMVVDYITDAYQNFVDTVESALPNTRKGGTKAMDVFLSLEKRDDDKAEVEKEAVKEEVK